MMLADAEDVEADLVGQFDLLEQFAHAIGIGRSVAFRGGHGCGDESIDTDLHHAVILDVSMTGRCHGVQRLLSVASSVK